MKGVATKSRIRRSRGDVIFDTINHLIMLLLLIIIIYPIYFIVLASVTDPDIVNAGKLVLFPHGFYTDGYKSAFGYAPLWQGYRNTIVFMVVCTLISTTATVTAGYAVSRKDLWGRSVIMKLFTFTMFFGGGLVPSFMLIKNLGLYDTIWALALPSAVSVYNMIVCRSFFEQTIPTELLEAAQLDGCNDFQFYFRIVIPLSTTIIAVMALFFGTGRWNAYFDSMIYFRTPSKMPLQIILRNLLLLDSSGTSNLFNDPEAMAAAQRRAAQMKYCVIVLSAAPMLIIYPFLQRYFVKGVMIGSVKG